MGSLRRVGLHLVAMCVGGHVWFHVLGIFREFGVYL